MATSKDDFEQIEVLQQMINTLFYKLNVKPVNGIAALTDTLIMALGCGCTTQAEYDQKLYSFVNDYMKLTIHAWAPVILKMSNDMKDDPNVIKKAEYNINNNPLFDIHIVQAGTKIDLDLAKKLGVCGEPSPTKH